MDPTGHDSNAFYADAAADELPDLSLPTIDASSDEEDGSQRVILVPDDSPARPLRRPRPRTLQSDSLFKLRYIVGHPLDCVSGSDSPFTHLAAFIRIDCPEDMLRRFAGIADVAAEKILAIHEVAAAREQHRRMRAGIGASADSRDAPVAPGTFAKSLLPVPQLAAAMLDKLLAYVDGRLGVSGVRAYAVRVTPDDLYIGPVREPPDVTAILHRIPKEYICGICLSAKSHPVIFKYCMHSFCYVCVRMAFNESFACPICAAVQYDAPLPAEHEWNHIKYEILPEIDWTIIPQNWHGIRFPNEANGE